MQPSVPTPPGVHLLRGRDRDAEVEALVARLGGRVGLAAVLDDLDRTAHATRVPAPAATWGFRWDREDVGSRRWWPQGITTAGAGTGIDPGRAVLVTSAYSHRVDGTAMGTRLSFVDLTDPTRVRYRHVLLVEPFLRRDGEVDLRPVRLHAGGLAWHGRHVHVAGTARGLSCFDLGDLLRVPTGDPQRLGVRHRPPSTVDAFGFRYVLPLRSSYDAGTSAGTAGMRYSFVSLDASTEPPGLVAGEYGRGDMSTRLLRFDLDPATSRLRADADGRVRPQLLADGGVPGMQGAVCVDGTWYVTTSRGRYRLGSLWTGRPGELREHPRQLPVGPEDLAYGPQHDQLWSLSEYPGARYVFAMPRSRFH